MPPEKAAPLHSSLALRQPSPGRYCVLGETWGAADFTYHATIWTAAGGLQDLNDLTDASGTGWTLTEARAINGSKQIVGYGTNPDGDMHAFLLTPVPEPSTLLLAVLGGAGVAALGYRVRRRASAASRPDPA